MSARPPPDAGCRSKEHTRHDRCNKERSGGARKAGQVQQHDQDQRDEQPGHAAFSQGGEKKRSLRRKILVVLCCIGRRGLSHGERPPIEGKEVTEGNLGFPLVRAPSRGSGACARRNLAAAVLLPAMAPGRARDDPPGSLDSLAHRAAVTRQTMLPTSSATSSPPRWSIATPTAGRRRYPRDKPPTPLSAPVFRKFTDDSRAQDAARCPRAARARCRRRSSRLRARGAFLR